jgi:hypothetical protein
LTPAELRHHREALYKHIANTQALHDSNAVAPAVVAKEPALTTVASAHAPLDPDDILDEIGKGPLLSSDATLGPYLGLAVKFRGELWSLASAEGDCLRVQVSTPRHDWDVWFDVSRNQYPQLALAKKGARLVVEGVLNKKLAFGWELHSASILDYVG